MRQVGRSPSRAQNRRQSAPPQDRPELWSLQRNRQVQRVHIHHAVLYTITILALYIFAMLHSPYAAFSTHSPFCTLHIRHTALSLHIHYTALTILHILTILPSPHTIHTHYTLYYTLIPQVQVPSGDCLRARLRPRPDRCAHRPGVVAAGHRAFC
jgi:hypothetical protein